MRSSSKGSAASLSRPTASVSSVSTFVNRLNTSKLTIWLEWMGVSLILSTKWAEFLTYDEDLPEGWWSLQGSSSIDDMLNLGCWQWVSMEYDPYEFLEGHICTVADCNVESVFCLWYEIFILTKDLWQLPFRLQGIDGYFVLPYY